MLGKRDNNLVVGRMQNFRPKFVVLVAYKSKDKSWRGFCFPYDVSCNAKTKNEAFKKLDTLVRLYEEGLEKYNYPQHLSVRRLTDNEDIEIFKKVSGKIISHFLRHLQEKMRKDMLAFQRERFWKEVNDVVKDSSVRIYSPTLSGFATTATL